MSFAKFKLGDVGATRAVADRMIRELHFAQFVSESLKRHVSGDWGDTYPEDAELNDDAVKENDGRILSVYIFPKTKEKIWIITEADRSSTTVLYLSDY